MKVIINNNRKNTTTATYADYNSTLRMLDVAANIYNECLCVTRHFNPDIRNAIKIPNDSKFYGIYHFENSGYVAITSSFDEDTFASVANEFNAEEEFNRIVFEINTFRAKLLFDAIELIDPKLIGNRESDVIGDIYSMEIQQSDEEHLVIRFLSAHNKHFDYDVKTGKIVG